MAANDPIRTIAVKPKGKKGGDTFLINAVDFDPKVYVRADEAAVEDEADEAGDAKAKPAGGK